MQRIFLGFHQRNGVSTWEYSSISLQNIGQKLMRSHTETGTNINSRLSPFFIMSLLDIENHSPIHSQDAFNKRTTPWWNGGEPIFFSGTKFIVKVLLMLESLDVLRLSSVPLRRFVDHSSDVRSSSWKVVVQRIMDGPCSKLPLLSPSELRRWDILNQRRLGIDCR